MDAPTTGLARLRDDELSEGFAVFDRVVVDEAPGPDSSRDGVAVELCAAIARLHGHAPGLLLARDDGQDRVAFPSARGKQLPMHALSKLLEKLRIGAVPHGFCSSLRDWALSGRNTRAR